MRNILLLCSLPLILTACAPYLKKAPPGDYDLVADTLTYTPTHVKVGDGVVFDKIVKNEGADDIPGNTYNVDLYLDGVSISFDHDTSKIPSGKDVKYGMSKGYHHFKPDKPGTYHYKWIIDKENNLPETNENNNVIEGDIIVTE